MKKLSRTALTALSALTLALSSPLAAMAYTVTKTVDDGSEGTLRYGVDSTSDDTIDFDSTNDGTPYDVSNGQLNITRNLTINGNGISNTTLDASNNNRIFNVQPEVVFNLNNATVTNGNVEGNGGAISNSGTTNLDNTVVSNSTATGDGGGIYNTGTLGIDQTTVTNNTSYGEGGGLASSNGSSTMITASTFDHNTASECGGGIYVGDIVQGSSLDVTNTTISTNTSYTCGGGVAFSTADHIQFTNATIVKNSVQGESYPGVGGGVYVDNGLLNCLENAPSESSFICFFIYGGTGGGGFFDQGTANAQFVNTIVALNTGTRVEAESLTNVADDCNRLMNSQGDNLDTDGDCFNAEGDIHADPKIGPLAYNGGPTRTHALLAGSPAIDSDACPPPFTDQRGVPRPFGGICDIGAYEFTGSGGGLGPVGGGIITLAGFVDSNGDGLPDSGPAAGAMLVTIALLSGLYYFRRYA